MRWLPRTGPGHSAKRWDWMRTRYPEAAQVLDAMAGDGAVADYDYARILAAVDHAARDSRSAEALSRQLVTRGPGAALHPSGQRTLPAPHVATHDMLSGQVRLGSRVATDGTRAGAAGDARLDLDVLRTSLLAVGPPGCGKTYGITRPLVEHLAMAALTHRASVVVLDRDAEFDRPGWFDVTIDPLRPTYGISLFSGASPDVAADRLAGVLLPSDRGHHGDAAANALYACLGPYRAAFGTWPSIPELVGLLRADDGVTERVVQRLRDPEHHQWRELLDTRRRRADGGDAAVTVMERLARLDRPALRSIFDAPTTFDMADVNRPVRVRVALPESEYPEASRIIARVVASQFVQVATGARANTGIFKGLVVDGAGGQVDDYVAGAAHRLRTGNAGVVLNAGTLGELTQDVRSRVTASVGCTAVFGGLGAEDVSTYAHAFGDTSAPREPDTSAETPRTDTQKPVRVGLLGIKEPEKVPKETGAPREPAPALWTAANIAGIPRGHCLLVTTRSNGFRTGPALVDLRG